MAVRDTKRELEGLRFGLSLLSILSVLVGVAGVLLMGYGLWMMVR